MAGSLSATQVSSGGKAKLGGVLDASYKKLTSGGKKRAARETRHKPANSISIAGNRAETFHQRLHHPATGVASAWFIRGIQD